MSCCIVTDIPILKWYQRFMHNFPMLQLFHEENSQQESLKMLPTIEKISKIVKPNQIAANSPTFKPISSNFHKSQAISSFIPLLFFGKAFACNDIFGVSTSIACDLIKFHRKINMLCWKSTKITKKATTQSSEFMNSVSTSMAEVNKPFTFFWFFFSLCRDIFWRHLKLFYCYCSPFKPII